MSPYLTSLRERIGHDLLLLPAVSAVIRDENGRILLARSQDDEQWALIGGGLEPGEEPASAIAREIREELGVEADIGRIIGAYGGEGMLITYPNGDRCAYVTVAYECRLAPGAFALEAEELREAAWFTAAEIAALDTQPYVARILADADAIPAAGE
ncbi:NUDIX domain-containing protein [Agromyces archimandritae]|uniref:NUDIX domain-containing protein n=2 Tax=Agromyces archimandritae TaxID=2781962 RepID=A0A975FQC2_9MICO|nr:NUDIX domain-containing protein [Agromyces archimandritae]